MYYFSSIFVILLFSSSSLCANVPQKLSGRAINLNTNATINSSAITNIVWGSKAPENKFPYQISLQLLYGGTTWDHICGGSIYNSRYIITAAHCLFDKSQNRFPATYLSVVAGTIFWNGTGTRYNVSKTIPHPNYLASVFWNDIGLLQTSSSITYTDAILPVTLNAAYIWPLQRVTVSGWGGTTFGSKTVPSSDTLLYSDTFTGLCLLMPFQLCTATPGACYGDSGGPLVLTGTRELVGIVSNGLSGCFPPGVYTRISSYGDWIKSNAVTNNLV